MDWLSNFIKREKDSNRKSEGDVEISEENGLVFNGIFLPEEVVVQILSHVDLKSIIQNTFVCKRWNEIIKSYHLWKIRCERANKRINRKRLPWYVYYCLLCEDFFDKNLLLNNCGQDLIKHWVVVANGGNLWKIEEPPLGADPLPEEPDFAGNNSCFVTSFQICSKYQKISFKNNRLHQKILNEFKPKIYISEWFAGRFDCGCVYELDVHLVDKSNQTITQINSTKRVEQWEGSAWSKVELIFDDYRNGVVGILFYHKGNDSQFWNGHYGSKMSGGVVRISFDSISS